VVPPPDKSGNYEKVRFPILVVKNHYRATTKYIVSSEQIFDKIAGIGKIADAFHRIIEA
jgi:hypothetical protein